MMRTKLSRYCLYLSAFALVQLIGSGSVFEIPKLWQQTQDGFYNNYYRSQVIVSIQNGSPGPPDYGWGVGSVAEAVVDMQSLLGEVVDTIVAKNPDFSDQQAVWDRLSFDLRSQAEVHAGWFFEYDQYTRDRHGADNFGAPNEFERYLVFRNMGGPSDIWNNYNEDPNSDTLVFYIQFVDLLDFDRDGRVDPDEIPTWDGRMGGGYPSDYKPSVASPVTVPKGSGYYLHAGIGRQGAPIPILSIQDRYTLGEVVQLEPGGASTLDFVAERADPFDYYRWIYIVQSSTDLQTWTNRAHYPGNQQAVAHPITTTMDSEFWRIRIANEKDYRAFDLRPSDQSIDASGTTLSWKGAEAAERYEIYLSINPTIESDELLNTTTEPTLDIPTLLPDTTYHWQIVAVFADELKVASDVHSFTTRPE
ncbi:MAG: hypothetical protein GVY36_01915 [Verrucomicrobia bacterium]|jgi:hypothetical protein|nr:hypothetical protein [Verrucomicrobiota bacterium]